MYVLRTPGTAPFITNVSFSCVYIWLTACYLIHAVSLMGKIQQMMLEANTGQCLLILFIYTFCFIMLETLTELWSKLLTYGRSLWRSDLTDIQNKEEERAWKWPQQGCLYHFEVGKSNPWLIGLASPGGWGFKRGGHSQVEATERLSENP